MQHSIIEFLNDVLTLAPLRKGADFFEGESDSLLCLDVLLNQRVGVERATAAALAIHYHFGKPIPELEGKVSQVTNWPYNEKQLRRPARHLYRLISRYLSNPQAPVSELPDRVVGALASLERYYNRSNTFFHPLRKVELDPQTIRSLTNDQFLKITALNFPQENLRKQLASVAAILEMKRASQKPSRTALKALERVGDEAADTLLVYLFKERALIVDEYLRRILYRHFFIERKNASRRTIEQVMGSLIQTHEDAHRVHARWNEAGVLYCFAEEPNCGECPFNRFAHRV